jgi:hypothetical protein
MINGCGVVGRPLAQALNELGFDNVFVSVKGAGNNHYDRNKKERLGVLLENTGYKLLVASGGDPLEDFREYGMDPIGYVDEIVNIDFAKNISVIVDGTPNKKTAQLQKETLYDKLKSDGWNGSVIYSGGSEYGIAENYAGIPGLNGDVKREDYLGRDVRAISCNSHYLSMLLSLTGKSLDYNNVSFINADLMRRSRDVFEGQTKPLIDPQFEAKFEKNFHLKPSKYVRDVCDVFDEVKEVEYFNVNTLKLPTENFHMVTTRFTFNTPIPDTASRLREVIDEVDYAILYEGKKKLNMGKVRDLADIRMGVSYAQLTSPIYWPMQENDKQLLVVGLTPQMQIDRVTKAVKIIEETGKFSSFEKSFDYVLDNVNEYCTKIPLRKFNREFQEVLQTHY